MSEQLGNIRAEQIKRNHYCLKSTAEVLLLCKHEMQFVNTGSHLCTRTGKLFEILQLVAKYDPTVQLKLRVCTRNASYVHISRDSEYEYTG